MTRAPARSPEKAMIPFFGTSRAARAAGAATRQARAAARAVVAGPGRIAEGRRTAAWKPARGTGDAVRTRANLGVHGARAGVKLMLAAARPALTSVSKVSRG